MKKILCIICIFSFVFSFSGSVSADDVENYADVCIQEAQEEIDAFVNESDLPMEVENLLISLRSDVDLSNYSNEEIAQLIEDDIETMKALMSGTFYSCVNHTNSNARLIYDSSTGRYTAEVWAGVPAMGWCTIKQDFTAKIQAGKILSIALRGGGYMTGVSWGTYSHVDSWYDISVDETKVDIYIKGTINYLLNLVNLSHSATFVESLEVVGTRLEAQ